MSEPDTENRATIRDVAQAAGVSISTVSRAFARPGRVSASTAKRVFAAADALGYRARAVDTPTPADDRRLHGILAISVADIANPVFADYVKSAQHQCMSKGFGLMVIDAEETGAIERNALRLAHAHVDGFILASSRASDVTIRKIAEIKPAVTINRPVRGLQSISGDPAPGLEAAIGRLVDLGHDSLTYLSGPEASWQDGMRWRTISASCARHRITLRRVPGTAPTYAGGYGIAPTFLDNPTTAVIAYNDIAAIGFMAALRARGYSVPGDVSVIGVDDLPVSMLVEPRLSSVRLPRRQLGRQAVDALIGRLHHTESHPNFEPVMLPSSFVERASIGPAHP
ncbi:LacI family DNA-binding transcriptional regulator [Bifidobacterium eulemuris]|uniref:LacI family DNA-binding transcriptional regulator n=1 Tax=Bifidobacterium eulemuris TaxID=1765219 RepID=A0A261G9C0_9BIFI|nr:LacI family DNA-binding transcriptional regulator [Bifidobacterium eulemuris]OZG68019.1 LacI family transcriptional regulator [Bifidobacterium eulemuris]QOL31903.1 LacI family DNA-binding transcriptional regulator [Bifidobacterium eulemuris]